MKHIYTSIDIGSDTIKIVVCELNKNKLNLLATSSVKSSGVKRGLIVNVEEASNSIQKGINEVEQMLGVKIRKVMATVPGYLAEYIMIKGEIKIENEDGLIDGSDVTKVLEVAMKSKLKPTYEMVTIMPIGFTINGEELKDPKGIEADNLEVRAIMVMTPKKNIYSVVSLIENIGIEVVDVSLNNIGDLYTFKTKDMEEKIGAVINIGLETTTVSLYNKGIVVKSSILPFGGKNIDNDINYIYKFDNDSIIKIKERFALAHKRHASVHDIYDLGTQYGEELKINQFEISEVVMARIEDILTKAKEEIEILTNKNVDYIIITGGVSNMPDFNLIAEEVLGKNVIIGDIKLIGIRDNKYSSAIGNIIYFINKLKLKGKNYSMFTKAETEEMISTKKEETMVGKVFNYFFGE